MNEIKHEHQINKIRKKTKKAKLEVKLTFMFKNQTKKNRSLNVSKKKNHYLTRLVILMLEKCKLLIFLKVET